MSLIPGTLPSGACYGTPQELLDLFAQYLDIPAFAVSSKVIYSAISPMPNTDFVWVDTAGGTTPVLKLYNEIIGNYQEYPFQGQLSPAGAETLISGKTAILTPASGDYLLISQSGVLKKITYGNLVPAATPTNKAFFFYKSVDQTVSSNITTKCTFDTTLFNQSSIITLSSSTFTPTVSGYYQITAQIHALDGGSGANASIAIYKNGSATNGIHGPVSVNGPASSSTTMVTVSGIMNFNGTSDTFEIYGRTYSVTWKVGSATAVLAIPSLTYATYVHGFYLGA